MTAPIFLPENTAHPPRDRIGDTQPGLPRLNALTEIIEAIAAVYGICHSDIVGRARTKSIAEARMLCCLVSKRCSRMSFTEIGAVLGRDHTTVMALLKSAERQRARDAWFAATAAEMLDRFGAAEEVTTQ